MSSPNLTVDIASGETLDVRSFSVEDGVSQLFEVKLVVVSPNPDVDFEAAIGGPARFAVNRISPATSGFEALAMNVLDSAIRSAPAIDVNLLDAAETLLDGPTRYWSGICAHIEQTGVEDQGLSTYTVRIVPTLWLLTQRKNYRIFQDKSELDIVLEILASWGILPVLHLDPASYIGRRMRVQYAETDFDFVSRMLEDIGVAYYFEQKLSNTVLALADAPNRRLARKPLRFIESPNASIDEEYVTRVRTHREIKPGRYTQSDVDWRKPLDYSLAASSSQGNLTEARLERYHHNYGSFLWKAESGDTPHADVRGAARTNEREAAKQVQKRLDAQRVQARVCCFETTAYDVRPGNVITIGGHPRREIGSALFIVASHFKGTSTAEWTYGCEARYADTDYRPPLKTPKPRTRGVEAATVTGPSGEAIHTDEFGRVRVRFHWDREGTPDEHSSCWVPVSQPSAGSGMGSICLPRVGQEVLIDFLGADPDRPLVIGTVFTSTTPPPFALPKHKTVSGIRSESTQSQPRTTAKTERKGSNATTTSSSPTPPANIDPREAMRFKPDKPYVPSDTREITNPRSLPGGRGVPPEDETWDQYLERKKQTHACGALHRHSGGALTFDDQAGHELTYLQAQRDCIINVKSNLSTTVGHNRDCLVIGQDTENVRGCQTTTVTENRTIEVTGFQQHTVVGDMIVNCDGSQHAIVKKDVYCATTEGGQTLQAKTKLVFQVGDLAALIITPTAILINAPMVFINPGMNVMAAVYGDVPVEDAVAAEQKAQAAAETAAKEAAEAKAREDHGRTQLQMYRNMFPLMNIDPKGSNQS